MNVNDVVLYTESGQTAIATVLEVRYLDNHLGAKGEPLLHLGFFSPVMAPGANGKPQRVSVVGTHQQYDTCQFRLDVAHKSHSFDVKMNRPMYPGGRWEAIHIIPTEVEDNEDVLTEEIHTPELPDSPDSGEDGGIETDPKGTIQ